ncbi:hypothetical protein HNP32_003449 [Brevundimonas bullata]|uniref:Uncharacterized protein n=1 Tax=Brevundimonas bullata TaxID=13160 RepID=A0A7W7ISF1_9CAUL|nr:hypothetical protein [Brevundimonas bullata]MBB6384689.1 hypothetical protein [Brevundimonas bullata]
MSNNTVQAMIGAGLSKSFAYHVASGARSISVPLALWLHEHDGLKVGPLIGKTPSQIRALRSVYEPKAPDSVVRRRQRN